MDKPDNARKALLFVGSPKGLKSTSFGLGSYLLRKLEAGGMMTETMIAGAALHTPADIVRMLETVASADLVLFAFPLYVDQLPAPLIRAIELIADDRRSRPAAKVQRIMAIVQSGFPETHQNALACDIMGQFARQAGFEWAGALAMGMGGALGGRPLEKAGGMARNVIKAFDLTAVALLRGDDVPGEASALISKPIIPQWLYLLIANYGMRSGARKHGARKQIYARPYVPAGGGVRPRG